MGGCHLLDVGDRGSIGWLPLGGQEQIYSDLTSHPFKHKGAETIERDLPVVSRQPPSDLDPRSAIASRWLRSL